MYNIHFERVMLPLSGFRLPLLFCDRVRADNGQKT